jgi:quercetin dioxygenase-like cupin family protein
VRESLTARCARIALIPAEAVLAFALGAALLWSTNANPAGREQVAFSRPLQNAPGQDLTAVVVSYAPGARSPRHVHAGSVLAYVLTGEIRSKNSETGPARVYKAGEAFFESPGSAHLISENASTSNPASLLAIFVAPSGAVLTTIEPEGEAP